MIEVFTDVPPTEVHLNSEQVALLYPKAELEHLLSEDGEVAADAFSLMSKAAVVIHEALDEEQDTIPFILPGGHIITGEHSFSLTVAASESTGLCRINCLAMNEGETVVIEQLATAESHEEMAKQLGLIIRSYRALRDCLLMKDRAAVESMN